MRRFILTSAIIAGSLAIAAGLALGVVIQAFRLLDRGGGALAALRTDITALTLALLGLGYGLAWVVIGWRGLAGGEGAAFSLGGWGWWLAATIGVLIAGQVAFSARLSGITPYLHIAAGALPPLLFLAAALNAAHSRGGAVSARPAVGSLAWGGLGGVTIALALEVILIAGALLVLSVWINATRPDLLEQLRSFALRWQRSAATSADLSEVAPLLTSPAVVVTVLGFIAIIVPLVEELSKTLAVPLVALTGRRLTRLDGLLLGVAAGAGFTMFEGILSGAAGLALTTTDAWAVLMLARGGTAVIHCLASGLAGLGWQAIIVERRWPRGLGLALCAVGLHGAWNLSAGGVTLAGLRALIPAATPLSQGLAGLLSLLLISLLAALWLGSVVALPLIARSQAAHSPARELLAASSLALPADEMDQTEEGTDLPVEPSTEGWAGTEPSTEG